MYVFTAPSCVWVRNDVEILRGPPSKIEYKTIILMQ